MTNKALGKLKAFGMTNQMVVEDLSRIGKLFAVELGHLPTTAQGQEDVYIILSSKPQCGPKLRK